MAKLSLFLLVFAGLVLGGCEKERSTSTVVTPPSPATTPATTAPAPAPTVTMQIGGDTFHLEIAANDRDRQHGLMYRQSMPVDHGMIFVFGDDKERDFWMQNTFIPLDIIYVNAAGRVVSIKHGVPLQEEPTIPSDEPMKWAIELNDGAAEAAGVRVGSKLQVPEGARQAQEN